MRTSNTTEYLPLPQPEELSEREKEDAMGAYLMMFAAVAAGLPLPIINLIASIIYYFINKSKSRFVRFHAYQSLLSQIPTSLINAGLVFWAVRIFFFDWEINNTFYGYLWMAIIANLLYFIFSIVAAVRARKGRFYYFIFFGKLAYHQNFTASKNKKSKIENAPPKM